MRAVHFFLQIIAQAIEHVRPAHLSVALDPPRMTLKRKKAFPAYKDGRKKSDDPEVRSQFKRCLELIEALGMNPLELKGWEADDIIATQARLAAKEGHQVVVASRDKDLHQVITDSVTVFDPQTREHTDEKRVMERWGVPPRAVPYFQALVGDSSDNIPGVRGLGEKTAQAIFRGVPIPHKLDHRWLRRVALERTSSATMRAKIEATDLQLMVRLTKLHTRLDVESPPKYLGFTYRKAEPLLRELGLKTFQRRRR